MMDKPDVHRAINVVLDDDMHDLVHDQSRPKSERAEALLDHLTEYEPLGHHWTTDPDMATYFHHYHSVGPHTTHVIFHASHPDEKDIITDPVWRDEHDVNDSEDEIPVQRRADMEIKGISWRPHGRETFEHHVFADPQWHKASRSEGLFPRKMGSTLEDGIKGYFGGGDGRDQELLRVAGRGKPRRSPSGGGGDATAPVGGGGGPAQGEERGEAGSAGGRPEGPRPVEFHPQAQKDLKTLDKPVQRQIMGVINDLANDDPVVLGQTHALTMALKGWSATKASRGHRIVHRPSGEEGGIHIGYIGLHDYDKAIRRLTAKEPRWYHGSPRKMEPGTDLIPGLESNKPEGDHEHIWVSQDPFQAAKYGDVYEVKVHDTPRQPHRGWPEHYTDSASVHRYIGNPNDAPVDAPEGTKPKIKFESSPSGSAHRVWAEHGGRMVANLGWEEDGGVMGDWVHPDYRDSDLRDTLIQRARSKGHHVTALAEKTDVCPCGLSVALDPVNGWQHADGSVSHDGEHYGKSVSELMKNRKTSRVVKVSKKDVMQVAPYLGDAWHDGAAEDFRRVLFTSPKSQYTLMTLKPGEEIGEEIHDVDQIIMLLSGSGHCLLDGNVEPFTGTAVLCVPTGTRHNVMNGDDGPMRLATVYAPAHHSPGTVHHTKDDAKRDHSDEFQKTSIRNIDPIPRYQELDKPWERTIYDVPEKVDKPIYRGMAIPLSEADHAYVHDRSIRPGSRAARVVELAAKEPLGMHWSVDSGQAHHWSRVPVQGMSEHPHVLSLVLHAHPPEPEHIEHDPRTLWHHSVQGHVAEGEVPLKEGSPVRINGVEWSDARDYTKSHQFWAGPGAQGIIKNAKRRPRLKGRIFGPSKGSLDPRLFDGKVLKPEVRSALLERLSAVLDPLMGLEWPHWSKVYLAGSEASEWWGNDDLDVLVGVDYDEARRRTPELADLDDQQITDMMNAAFRVSYNDEDWQAPFGDTWHATAYCNLRSYDIKAIKPYAAYNITDSVWSVRPPHLLDWSVEKFPAGPGMLAEARGYADIIEAIDKMPEPFRTQQGTALWEHLHGDRSRAFSAEGEGWQDPGNAIEKALVEWGVWDKLVDLKFGRQKTAAREPDNQRDLEDEFRDNWETSSHISKHLTGASAHVMGIPGYEHALGEVDWLGSPEHREDLAKAALRAIKRHPGSPEPLYHGSKAPGNRFRTAQPGDHIDVPLTATSGAYSVAHSFASPYGKGNGVIMHFPKGTPHFEQPGVDAENWADPDDRYSVGEGVVAGRFRVKEKAVDDLGHTHLKLEHVAHFDPDSQQWTPSRTRKTSSKGEYCPTCKTEHQGYFEPEDHERSHTDWDRYYDKIRPEIHRGMAVQLSPEAHRIVHGDAPEHEKAQALMDELSSTPLGMHWTDNSAEMAGNISQEDAEKSFTPRQRQNLTHVIFHADKPAREHIETDINRLVNGSVISYPDSSENEVPLKENAPVNIWGVSWKHHDPQWNPYDTHEDSGWHFHEFEQPVRKTAGAKVEHVLIDKLWPHREWDHQPGGYSYDREGGGPYGWKHDQESWEANRQSVADEGIREPLTLEYNPKQHAAYIGEGNHRLHWAREAGHTTVPLRVWRTSKEMHPRYELPGSHRLPEGEHVPQDLSPRDVLPEDWFPAQQKQGRFSFLSVKGSDHPLAPDLPQEQHDALTAEPMEVHKRKMLELARNPVSGVHMWRGEVRKGDPIQGARETGVGIHWGLNPDTIVRPPAYGDDEHEVVYHAELEHPGEQNFDRSHPMWGGSHRSLDSEAEVRLKPGGKVKLHGVWVRDPHHSDPGYFVPRLPERMGGQWTYHPIGEHVSVAHRPSSDVIDYTDVGVRHEGVLRYFTADYRLQHRAPDENSGKPLHHYEGGDPDDLVRIYRSAPHDVDYLDNDTWVTKDPAYAHQHSYQYDNSPKWPVMSAEVPKRHVYWDENDPHEFGYQGPRLESHHLEEHDEETGGLKPFEGPDEETRRDLELGGRFYHGLGVHLPSHEHAFVHDESKPIEERAKTVFKHVPEGVRHNSTPYWQDDPEEAEMDTYDEDRHIGGHNTPLTRVVVHGSQNLNHAHGISWADDDDVNRSAMFRTYHHHEFKDDPNKGIDKNSMLSFFTAAGDPDLHAKAERYVEGTTRLSPHNLDERFHYEPHEPHPDESDEEFALRRSRFQGMADQAKYGYQRMAQKWAFTPREDRDEFRRKLHAQSQKPLYIATSHAHDIIGRDGRMKTLSELGAERKGEYYFRARNAFEHHIMGIHEDTAPKARPIYGAATDEPEGLWYGEHHLELKPHVRKRTTATMGDSLDSVLRNYSIDHLKDLDDEHIISTTSDNDFDSMRHYGAPHSYLEFQVHGGVDRDDIERLHVHGRMTDEKHNLIRTALENGIGVVHHGHRGPQVLTEPPRLDIKTRSSKKPRRFSLNGRVRLNLGRGAFAHYRRGMAESDPIDVFHDDGVKKTTWGGLLALSNGELLKQIPEEPKTEDYFGSEE